MSRRCTKLRSAGKCASQAPHHTNKNLITVFRHKPIYPIQVDYESAKRLLFNFPFFKILAISFEWIFCNFYPRINSSSDQLSSLPSAITRIVLINQATRILCLIGNWIECEKINASKLILLLRSIVAVWKRYLDWMHFNWNFFDQIK